MKYHKGDKVVPILKSVWESLDGCPNWKASKKRGWLYVNGYNREMNVYFCGHNENNMGDYFIESDLTPYIEQLPEEYIVETSDEDHTDVLEAWRDYSVKIREDLNWIPLAQWKFLRFSREPNLVCSLSAEFVKNLPLFSYSEWKKLYKTKQMKKIIAYEAPFNVSSCIPKGAKMYLHIGASGYYVEGKKGQGSEFYLDEEFVQTHFTPIYKENKLSICIAGATLVISKEGNIDFNFRGNRGSAHISELVAIQNSEFSLGVTVGGNSVVISEVHIGCANGPNVSMEDIHSIIRQYNNFK